MIVNLSKLLEKISPYLVSDSLNEIQDYYCPLKEAYNWKIDSNVIGVENAVDFEEKIKIFLLGSTHAPNSDNVRVIIGGIGTGKTTTINSIFRKILSGELKCKRENITSGCGHFPQLLNLDFEKNEEGDSDDEFREENMDELWKKVSSTIQVVSNITFDNDPSKLIDFLIWCQKQQKLLEHCNSLQASLEANKIYLYAYKNKSTVFGLSGEEIVKKLVDYYYEITRQMPSKDYCWYVIYKYKYQITEFEKKDCKCIYILLDNVDHLHPEMQKRAVSFAINLTEILNAKTVITIRPLTWERSSHAHTLVDILYQYSPSVTEVLVRRVNWFLKNETVAPEEKTTLLSLTSRMTDGAKHFNPLSKLLVSTSGIGVRFALRNFANMLESTLLSNIVVDNQNSDPINQMHVYVLARAYLYGPNQYGIYHAFENLYEVDQKTDTPLLKIRVLDFLDRISSGQTEVIKLFNFTEAFGYNQIDIIEALNELMDRRRPLIWSNIGYKFSHKGQTPLSGKLMITPIGKGYIKNLFGIKLYDEQCLSKRIDDFVGMEKVYSFHKTLAEEDLKDIKKYCNSNGAILYKKFYSPDNIVSLSYLHWRNLSDGFERINRNSFKFDFDYNRLEWIKRQVSQVLEET